MRMVLLTYGGDHPERVDALLTGAGVAGFTELHALRGHGLTGPREGTRVWPGEVRVTFAVVPDDGADRLLATVRGEAAGLPAGERLHAALMPILDYT